MSENTLFKPKNAPIRQPLSDKRVHGAMVNPPRLPEVGQMKLGNSISRNDMSLKKPGGTR
jgi:hypothetical protein